MKDEGEEDHISCARSDTESTCIIHWVGSLKNPSDVHSHLRFVKLRGMKSTNSVLSLHFGGALLGTFVLWGFVGFFSCTHVNYCFILILSSYLFLSLSFFTTLWF